MVVNLSVTGGFEPFIEVIQNSTLVQRSGCEGSIYCPAEWIHYHYVSVLFGEIFWSFVSFLESAPANKTAGLEGIPTGLDVGEVIFPDRHPDQVGGNQPVA
jgi:hypothetical protein